MADTDALSVFNDQQPPPAPPPAATELANRGAQIMQESAASFDKNRAAVVQSMADERAAQARQAQATQPILNRMEQLNAQPLPQPPTPQKPPPPPSKGEMQADEQWLLVAGVLGALAGGLTRNHATNALAAMSGALSGYQEGSKQKFDQGMKTWEAENQRIIETNKAASDEYNAILNNRRLTMDQMAMQLQLAAARYKDDAAMRMAQTKDFVTLAQMDEKRSELGAKMMEWSARITEAHAKWTGQYQGEFLLDDATI